MAEQEEEIQQPEKPVKKKKSSGGLSLPMMIAIGAGTLIVLVGISLFAISYMVNNIIDKKLGSQADSSKVLSPKEEAKLNEKKKENELDNAYKELEEEEYFETDEGVGYLETDRIVTNPKFSTRFAVLKLGLSYREKVNPDEEKEEKPKEGEIDPKAQKMQAQIKSIINNMIGSMTEEELQQQRSNLAIIVKEKLTPIFKKHKMFLRDVLIVEFIVQ